MRRGIGIKRGLRGVVLTYPNVKTPRATRNPREAKRRRDEAIKAVAANAGADLLHNALDRVRTRQTVFTGDDVWAELGDEADTITEPRLLGAVLRQARSAGRIEPTAEYVPSTRPSRHAAPIRVWRTLAAKA